MSDDTPDAPVINIWEAADRFGEVKVKGAAPIEELEQLADEFDEYATGEAKNAQELAECQTWSRAADKVREVLEQHE